MAYETATTINSENNYTLHVHSRWAESTVTD